MVVSCPVQIWSDTDLKCMVLRAICNHRRSWCEQYLLVSILEAFFKQAVLLVRQATQHAPDSLTFRHVHEF